MKNEVISLLNKKFDALSIQEIFDELGLTTSAEMSELIEVLGELVNSYAVYETKKSKYILYEHCPNFKKGVIQLSKTGSGFLLQNGKDIHIARDMLNYALDGDIVVAEIIGGDEDHPEGKVIKILKRSKYNIVGTIKSNNGELYFEPNDPKMSRVHIAIDYNEIKKCVEGEVVVVSIVSDNGKNNFFGRISTKLGHKDDPGMDIKVIAANYDIYDEFPYEAMDQANSSPDEVVKEDWSEGRVDLRELNMFTIDGDDTKDIDDGIALEYKDGYYYLDVCIMDVGHYVPIDSPLDKEAFKRGTSSYLADSVIPMLPHKLSNGICSLNPGVERCVIACRMKFDGNGKLCDTKIEPAVVKSRKKMTYKCVNEILEHDNVPEGYEEYADTLKKMNDLAHILRDKLVKRGYVDFNLDEPKIICDETGKAIDVKRRDMGEGEKLIEMFMIAANEAVAEYVTAMELPFIYRIHDEPREERLQAFIRFCGQLGHPIKGKYENITPKGFQKLLAQIEAPINGKTEQEAADESYILRGQALRSMAKAIYSHDNMGHFGIGSRCYCHFTSPIRRYPDLMVNRILHAFLFNEYDEKTIKYFENALPAIADQCSKREQAAVNAERDVDKMKMAELMEDHIGEEFDGIITTVSNSGFFVELPNLIDGFVPLTSLADDYYEADIDNQRVVPKSGGHGYRVGERVRVQVLAASKANSTIDFGIVKNLRKDYTTRAGDFDSFKGKTKVLEKKKGKKRKW